MKPRNIFTAAFIVFFILFSFAQDINAKGNKPKNIILLIGDGMGLTAVSSSILTDPNSSFRSFKFIGLSITCSADNLITDSAAGATALSTGERTNNHFLGVTPDGKPLQNIFEIAEKENYSTGLVVSSSITHATPAGFYAHISDRGNELKIAEQFLDSGIDVAIGAGRTYFLPESKKGTRKDNRDLIQELESKDYTCCTAYNQLESASASKKLVGLLEDVSLKDAGARDYSLGDLTQIALKRLSKNKKGFMLMVEGSQIDWGAHENNAKKETNEIIDFNKAVQAALDFARKDGNTLVVVTADHETGGAAITGGTLNKEANLEYVSKGHTAACVGIFAYGPGGELFQGVMDNKQIGKNFFSLLNTGYTAK